MFPSKVNQLNISQSFSPIEKDLAFNENKVVARSISKIESYLGITTF